MFDLLGPQQTMMVGCRATVNNEEKDNFITMDWHMPVSRNPFLYAVSIAKSRVSHKMIEQSHVFSVNFLSDDHRDKALFCGRNPGLFVDKIKEAKLEVDECQHIDCPLLNDSNAHLECEVVAMIDAGDHTIFLGKVVGHKIRNTKDRLFHMGEAVFNSLK